MPDASLEKSAPVLDAIFEKSAVTLCLIRHGQTDCNADARHGGWGNAQLTDLGVAQARQAAHTLRNRPFDRYYASDLTRAVDTFRHAFGEGTPCEQTPLLREINVGSLTLVKAADAVTAHGDTYIHARDYADFSAFGGESWQDLVARAAQFLTEIAALRTTGVTRVAAVTHGVTLRAIAAHALGVTDTILPLDTGNCSLSILRLTPRGQWRIHQWNVPLCPEEAT